jgi:mannose-6-phosphate isomerase
MTSMPAHDLTATALPLVPALVERPWGGRRLAHLAGGGSPPSGPIGEAWLAGPDSRVLDPSGGAPGERLADLAARFGERFVGLDPHQRYGARVPLLSKILDAAETLSVQVHPDDAYALAFEAHTGHLGKTEAWLVLDAEPGASVLWGFARAVTAGEVRDALGAGRLPALLRERPVRPGDVIVNQAGVVHAVGAGILLFELQQASDLTYRLYDFGRRDARGRQRELHLEQSLDVARLEPAEEPPPPRPVGAGRARLAATAAFTMERWLVGREGAPAVQAWTVEPRSLELWTVLEGEARIVSAGGERRLRQYGTVLLPAGAGPCSWHGEAVLVRGLA